MNEQFPIRNDNLAIYVIGDGRLDLTSYIVKEIWLVGGGAGGNTGSVPYQRHFGYYWSGVDGEWGGRGGSVIHSDDTIIWSYFGYYNW